MSKARQLADLGNVYDDGALSNRNRFINGNFDVWQRGTSFSAFGYGADRWINGLFGTSCTQTRQAFTLGQTDVPNNPTYFSRSTVVSSAGAANFAILVQHIEGVRTFAGQTATVSFWAKADASKDIAVEFVQYFGSGGSPSATIEGISVTTVSLTASWQKFTVTVDIPSISGKTLGTDNNDYLSLHFWFESGSDYASRNNSIGQQSGTFDIAQVQIEAGDTATPFEHRSYGQELALCQRYYLRWQPKVNSGATSYPGIGSGYATSSAAANFVIATPTTMRATPTVSFGGAVNIAFGVTGSTVSSVAAVYEPANNGFFISVNAASAVLTAGQGGILYLVNSTANYFEVSAEL